jgi:hypothetical protein
MATPCPRCGNTKTESVRHGYVHNKLWDMGYHLRRCSYCNRWRLFKRLDRTRPHPDDMTAEELAESFHRRIAQASGKTSETLKRYGGTMAANSSEESHGLDAQSRTTATRAEEGQDEVEDYRLCPKCGSSVYRRSRRRWYERLVKRPKMARCLKCDHRFPYPY